jgi:hypothetical protein
MIDPYASIADLYDFTYEDFTEDVDFYDNLAQSVEGPLLELGAGSGRVGGCTIGCGGATRANPPRITFHAGVRATPPSRLRPASVPVHARGGRTIDRRLDARRGRPGSNSGFVRFDPVARPAAPPATPRSSSSLLSSPRYRARLPYHERATHRFG